MVFYHGTDEEHWKKIQDEGVLFGVRVVLKSDGTISEEFHPSRCTYLAVDEKEARCYGDVVLKVDFDPYKNPKLNNYSPGCWQVRVYEPISLNNVTRI